MEDLKCPVCGKEMKLVPAGTSKRTGKPYDAFYACTDYGCKGTRRGDGSEKPSQWAKAEKSVSNQTSENIRRFEAGKEANMRTMASTRDAVLLVVAEMGQGSQWSEEDIKTRVKMWKDFMLNIYNAPF